MGLNPCASVSAAIVPTATACLIRLDAPAGETARSLEACPARLLVINASALNGVGPTAEHPWPAGRNHKRTVPVPAQPRGVEGLPGGVEAFDECSS